MACPGKGRSVLFDLPAVLAMTVRHRMNLEHRDSPGCHHVTRELHGSQGSSDAPWCHTGMEGAEPSLAPCPATGRAGPGGKALASTEATSGNVRQKGICESNHVVS